MNSYSTAHARFIPLEQAAAHITTGAVLLIAGDEPILRALPTGHWIGGSIPYFMTEAGGVIHRDFVFVHDLSAVTTNFEIRSYTLDRLPDLVSDAPDSGFSVVILPAGSEVHSAYAVHAPNYPDMFLKPVVGWVSGVHLSELGQRTPKVFNGETGQVFDQEAVVLHAHLPDGWTARVGIINVFKPGTGDTLVFPTTGFHAHTCRINGEEQVFADYLVRRHLDTRLPLVANYCGAPINVSIQKVDADRHQVDFYAPVFAGIEYRLAEPIPQYVEPFLSALPADLANVPFSCNCILNFLYSELEGKRIGHWVGPMTFGEIAYQLLNQTLVYLTVEPDEYDENG